jgi:hypothetical protein
MGWYFIKHLEGGQMPPSFLILFFLLSTFKYLKTTQSAMKDLDKMHLAADSFGHVAGQRADVCTNVLIAFNGVAKPSFNIY